jgi:hypothetical protein
MTILLSRLAEEEKIVLDCLTSCTTIPYATVPLVKICIVSGSLLSDLYGNKDPV